MSKISLIGAGQIGGTLAHLIGTKELVDEVFAIALKTKPTKLKNTKKSSSVAEKKSKGSGKQLPH